jgi:hypothetical protein
VYTAAVRRAAFLGVVVAAIVAALAQPASAQFDRGRESTYAEPSEKAEEKDPLRGSIFIFDQSATTQTLHLGLEGPQSYVPYYAWWLSLRPRWWFNDEWRVQGRVDYYKEFTNAENTTYRDEDVFGDLWTDLIYQKDLAIAGPWKNTRFSGGLRAQWPTSKASQANGIYVNAGAAAEIKQKIPLNGDVAPFFDWASVRLSLSYWHPFSNSITATDYQSFGYLRQDLDEHSFESTQISGQTLPAHTLWAAVAGEAKLTPRLDLSLNVIFVNQWHYTPTNAAVLTATGPVTVSHANDQQFTQLVWTLLVADYEIMDEFSLGVGYYNLANVIASDGTVRSVFGGGEDNLLWSPDARLFLDVTLNLDRLFEDASGRYRTGPGQTTAAAQAAREQRVAHELR